MSILDERNQQVERDQRDRKGLFARITGTFKSAKEKMEQANPKSMEKKGISSLFGKVKALFTSTEKAKAAKEQLKQNSKEQEDIEKLLRKAVTLSNKNGMNVEDFINEAKIAERYQELTDKQEGLEKEVQDNSVSFKERTALAVGAGAKVVTTPVKVVGGTAIGVTIISAKTAHKAYTTGKSAVRNVIDTKKEKKLNRREKNLEELYAKRDRVERRRGMLFDHIKQMGNKLIQANDMSTVDAIQIDIDNAREKYDRQTTEIDNITNKILKLENKMPKKEVELDEVDGAVVA